MLNEILLESISNKFWLVFDFPCDDSEARDQNILRGLQNLKMNGIRGISSSKNIMIEWWIVARNSVLIMDHDQVLMKNNVTEINYDDIGALCEDNMRILYRILNKDSSRPYDLYQLIMQYAFANISDSYVKSIYDYHGLNSIIAKSLSDDQSLEINSSNDLINAVASKYEEIKTSYGRIKSNEWGTIDQYIGQHLPNLVTAALQRIGETYKSESECLVNSNTLIVPKGSTLLIDSHPEMRQEAFQWKEDDQPMHPREWAYKRILGQYEMIKKYRLDELYRIRYPDGTKFNNNRYEIKSKRF